MLVTFYADSYAPGYVQAEIINKRTLARVMRHLKASGAEHPETTTLLQWEDAAAILPRRKFKDLEEGWTCTVRMDSFEALSLYGYDANTLA